MTELDVQGMSCGHCVSTVERAVKAIDASAAVRVDLGRGKVAVESAASADALAHAISAAGYPAAVSAAGDDRSA